MKCKKALSPLATIGTAILVIITIFVVAGSFTNIWGKGMLGLRQTTEASTTSNPDPDSDNIQTLFDDCPCESGLEKFNGCPSDKKPKTQEEIKRARACLEVKDEAAKR